MGQKWTRRLPTQAGWYWSKFIPPDNRRTASITIVHLVKGRHSGRLKCGSYTVEELAQYGDRLWCGPLEPPHAREIEE